MRLRGGECGSRAGAAGASDPWGKQFREEGAKFLVAYARQSGSHQAFDAGACCRVSWGGCDGSRGGRALAAAYEGGCCCN